MRAGRLRHRVTIQQLTAGSPQQNTTGEMDDDWTDFATVWAAIEPIRGRDLVAAQQEHADVEVKIPIRYLSGVTAKMRVRHDSINYSILYVINPGMRDKDLELMCSQGVNDG